MRVCGVLLLFLVANVIHSSIVKRSDGGDGNNGVPHEGGTLTEEQKKAMEKKQREGGDKHAKEEEIAKEQACIEYKQAKARGEDPDSIEECDEEGNPESSGRKKRSFIQKGQKLWTKCIIPFTIDNSTIPTDKMESVYNNVLTAIAEYDAYTGFRFVPYTGNNGDFGLDHEEYLRFVYDNGRCWSYVGNTRYFKASGQAISSCGGKTAIHEIGHALGLQHEQQNPNSLPNIGILYSEIKSNYVRYYLRKSIKDMEDPDSEFDIGSMMQYHPWTFRVADGPTMAAFDDDMFELLASNENSFYMFRDLQNFQKCFDEFTCPSDLVCHNDGYQSIVGGTCKCRCSPGFDASTNCATLDSDIACGYIKTFGATETTHTFSTPACSTLNSCMWHFISPPGTTMQIDFNDFNIVHAPTACYLNEHMELRFIRPGAPAIKVCATRYQKTTFTLENYLTVSFITNGYTGSAFNATVTVIKDADRCYTGDGSDGSYAGAVDYAKSFDQCVPWTDVTNCPYHQFESRSMDVDLAGKACRNVGVGPAPWCYTNATTCERQTCDACMHGACYDIDANCASLLTSDSTYCDSNTGKAKCMEACGMCASRIKKVRVTCGDPGDVAGISPAADTTQTTYYVGDTVTYTCPTQLSLNKTRVCTSEGTWSSLNYVCGSCPSGFSVFDRRCFKWLGYKVYDNYSGAKARCQEYGANLVKVDSQNVQDYIFKIINYQTEEKGLDAYLGVKKDSSQVWRWWETGDAVSYTNWKTGEPNTNAITCASMGASDGLWVDRNCVNFQGNVVCEFPIQDADSVNADQIDNCAALISKDPNMCTTWGDFAWYNCKHTCNL